MGAIMAKKPEKADGEKRVNLRLTAAEYELLKRATHKLAAEGQGPGDLAPQAKAVLLDWARKVLK